MNRMPMEGLSDNQHGGWIITKRQPCQIMAGGPSRRTVVPVERVKDGIRMLAAKKERDQVTRTDNSSEEQ